MTEKENYLRTVRFERPNHIPMNFAINPACWHHYDQNALQDLILDHKTLFPGYEKVEKVEPKFGNVARAGHPYTDDWGCVWETTDNGITGTVTKHPLHTWDAFSDYKAPDPEKVSGIGPLNWQAIEAADEARRKAGKTVTAGLRHGHTFLQLCDIRGYENLVYDMSDEEPRLWKLIEMIEDFNMHIVKRRIELGVDVISYPEDLGMQSGPMISPDHFRKYIKPSYQRLMKPARDAGCLVHMHSDGCIRDLVDDLIDGGVEIINLQDLVNGIDWIKDKFAGKTCIDIDLDRQQITRYGTPAQIDALIREEVEKLGSREGGLMMVFGLYPGTPLENTKAIMDAMEKYAFHYA